MQKSEQKRRCSILKKRRSRSMSPKSPKEHTVRRASRRISFSGKHNVREFFGNENTAIVWGETYDVSAEKHVLSNEQITLQSTRSTSMSATLQSTRNDSVAMDMSTIAACKDLPIEKTRPSIFLKPTSYPEDEKENIMVANDSDMELSFLTSQLTKPVASKSIFRSSLRPTLFNFAPKKDESPDVAERTNGSDNMDISGIEPTIQDQTRFVPSIQPQERTYAARLQRTHLATNDKDNHRQSINQAIDIKLDDTQPMKQPNHSINKISSRKTINESFEMSLDATKAPQPNVYGYSRQSVYQTEDMELEANETLHPVVHQSKAALNPSSELNTRNTINETRNLSISNTDDELKRPSRRSVHQVQDMELETSDTVSIMHQSKVALCTKVTARKTINEAQDLSICESSRPNFHANITESSAQYKPSEMKKPTTRRQTSHETHDISIDATPTNNKPKIFAPQNMSIAFTGEERRHSRRSIHQVQDMDLETVETSSIQRGKAELKQPLQVTDHKRFNETAHASVNISRANFGCNITELSVQYLSSETKKPATHRQTTHQAKDISINTSETLIDTYPQDFNQSHDMSLEERAASPSIQHGNSNWKKLSQSVNRMTINEPRDMSFDSNATGKSHAQSRNDKTILSNVSMDLQSTEPYYQHSRKSVICKSPSKNSTKMFDCSFELTKGIDQNPMYLSHHPLHSTKLNDMECSKFTNFDFDASIQGENIQNDTKISEDTFAADKENQVPAPIKRTVQIFNQSQNRTNHCTYALDMSDDSPVPTAKKFNLNKTPFYCGLDKENDNTNYLLGSDSDECLGDNSNDGKREVASKPRSTVYFDETINDDSQIAATNAAEPKPIEISDASIALIHPEHVAGVDAKKSIEPKEKADTMRRNSLFQLSSMESPIQINDSDAEKLSNQLDQIKRLSYGINEANAINESQFNFGNNSNNGEESKQLTFIADDDDEDQICNTKIDLASSLEGSINDFGRKLTASFSNMSHNFSKFSAYSDRSSVAIPNETTAELEAFRKSNRLRHSNVFDGIAKNAPMENSNHGKSVAKEETSRAEMSSTTQNRNSFGAYNEADETSFLTKRPDKPLSEIKLDFSGYEELIGLSTPMDVINDYYKRMEEINRIDREKEELRRKFANNEITMDQFISLYDLNNNGAGLVSQNVEAPSWSFLCKNKIDCELEQMRDELRRELETQPIEPLLPLIPDIQVLMLNKCRNLKNWIFDDVWFFKGNIHLRNKQFPAFKVCLVYDPSMAQSDCDLYGMMRFKKIIPQFCKLHVKERNYAAFKLQVQELNSKLPSHLLPMCETTTKLSEFDEKMHDYCVNAQNKVNDLLVFCRELNALIKEENGQIYIMQSMHDFENYEHQDFIIELSDIDTTAWRCVRTNPQRLLNDEIKKLSPGVPFIKELLTNASKYVPWK